MIPPNEDTTTTPAFASGGGNPGIGTGKLGNGSSSCAYTLFRASIRVIEVNRIKKNAVPYFATLVNTFLS